MARPTGVRARTTTRSGVSDAQYVILATWTDQGVKNSHDTLSERLINAGMAGCGGLAASRGAVRLRWAGAGPVFLDM